MHDYIGLLHCRIFKMMYYIAYATLSSRLPAKKMGEEAEQLLLPTAASTKNAAMSITYFNVLMTMPPRCFTAGADVIFIHGITICDGQA